MEPLILLGAVALLVLVVVAGVLARPRAVVPGEEEAKARSYGHGFKDPPG